MDKGEARSILVVDDHAVVRQGLVAALAHLPSVSISEADSYTYALDLSSHRYFDLAIIDFHLGKANGIDCALALSLLQSEMRFILLTVEENWQIIKSAESAGFRAFISKNSPLATIITTVEDALTNGMRFHCITSSVTSGHVRDEFSFLTPAQVEILNYLRSGATTREIATDRFCSEATVKSHLSAIYRKLGVRNRTEAVAALEGMKRR